MKLILKIAVGVFLGSVAAFIALKTPDWIKQSREEKARINRQVREVENNEKILRTWPILQQLTPATLITRCGKPASDDFLGSGSGTQYRFISYQDGSLTIVLCFEKHEKEEWQFGSVGTGVNTPVEKIGTTSNILLVSPDIAAFPCLDIKRSQQ